MTQGGPRDELPQVVAESLGGGPLARLAIENRTPQWFGTRPASAEEWRSHMQRVGSPPAQIGAALGNGAQLLHACTQRGGVVVTTGQQPGLFGGPLYTLHKAIGALELARELEATTGIPTMAVFWAATDDADFAEASRTWIRTRDGAQQLVLSGRPDDGMPLALVQLPDVSGLIAALVEAADSAIDLRPLALMKEAYRPGETVGGAYVGLLRALLEPLGVAVLDASHPAVLAAERSVLTRALERHERIAEALSERAREIVGKGWAPQVAHVDHLSLVFHWHQQRGKLRVPRAEAVEFAARAEEFRLSPNVLLRPVVERAILPTVAYLGGPGELSYFAQVSAVAAALDLDAPLAVPRWSATILEPDVLRMLRRNGIAWRELAAAHEMENRLARSAAPSQLLRAFADLRERLTAEGDALKGLLSAHEPNLDPRVVDGATRAMQFRVQRLERRLFARVKRREGALMREVAALRGALFPGGGRQERGLNFVPLLARHGPALLDAMRQSARRHAQALVHGTPLPHDE